MADHAARPDRGDGQGRRCGETCVRVDDGHAKNRRCQDRGGCARRDRTKC